MFFISANYMFSKLQTRFRTQRQEGAVSAFMQHPETDLRPTVLVTLLCAKGDACSRALKTHAASSSHRPIFVVCDPDIRAYQSAGCTFEHLPDPEMVRSMSDVGDWAGYLQERWRMINSKWQPRWTAAYGLGYREYLKKCTAPDI
jgi:hypothetical protein